MRITSASCHSGAHVLIGTVGRHLELVVTETTNLDLVLPDVRIEVSAIELLVQHKTVLVVRDGKDPSAARCRVA